MLRHWWKCSNFACRTSFRAETEFGAITQNQSGELAVSHGEGLLAGTFKFLKFIEGWQYGGTRSNWNSFSQTSQHHPGMVAIQLMVNWKRGIGVHMLEQHGLFTEMLVFCFQIVIWSIHETFWNWSRWIRQGASISWRMLSRWYYLAFQVDESWQKLGNSFTVEYFFSDISPSPSHDGHSVDGRFEEQMKCPQIITESRITGNVGNSLKDFELIDSWTISKRHLAWSDEVPLIHGECLFDGAALLSVLLEGRQIISELCKQEFVIRFRRHPQVMEAVTQKMEVTAK